jgi:hypothetical protein
MSTTMREFESDIEVLNGEISDMIAHREDGTDRTQSGQDELRTLWRWLEGLIKAVMVYEQEVADGTDPNAIIQERRYVFTQIRDVQKIVGKTGDREAAMKMVSLVKQHIAVFKDFEQF